MSPADPPRYHHGNLPAAAVVAALSLLCEGGEAAVSMREVAKSVGVTHRALYRWYPDRQALLAALAAEGFDGLACAIGAAVSATPQNPQPAFVRAYLLYARQHPALYRLAMSRSRAELKASPVLLAATNRLVAASLAWFGEADPRPRDFIITLWAMLHGLVSLMDTGLLAARDDEAIVSFGLALSRRIIAAP